MPWMMKYRVFYEQRCTESVQDQQYEKEIQINEDKEALASVAEELLGTTGAVVGLVDMGAKTVGDVGLTAVDTGVHWLSGTSEGPPPPPSSGEMQHQQVRASF